MIGLVYSRSSSAGRCALKAMVAGALATLVAAAPAATAFSSGTPDPTFSPAWAQDTALGYRWAGGVAPPAAMHTALDAGASDATATRGSRAPAFVYNPSAANVVTYGTVVPCGVNGLACFARNVPAGFGVWFRENGHRFDWGTLNWCEMTGSPTGCFSAETVMIDELGHVDGLDHHVNAADGSDYTDAVVQGLTHAKPQVGWNAKQFGRCDVAALQQVYDVPSWTTPYSTCLDVPASLSLALAPADAVSGPITFTALFKSAGTGRLNDNPIAGRTIVLQRLYGTAWTDVAAMSSSTGTAGSYSLVTTPPSGTTYRAVFRATSSEGLRAATSGSVITAYRCGAGPCPLSPVAAQRRGGQ